MDDPPSSSSLQSCQALEQFLLLAKTARGPAAVELIKQATEAPGVYVFGELLELECVQELAGGQSKQFVQLLELFAFGTYSDYKKNMSSLPPLSPLQTKKLKHLSIVSLAARCRTIQYETLLEDLDITDLRELEDLIIDAIYGGVIQAKLDQKNKRLEVECFIGRDIKIEQLGDMIEKLENWCANCGSVLQAVEDQIQRANGMKTERQREREKDELEIKQLKQTIKVASEAEEPKLSMPLDKIPQMELPSIVKTQQQKKGLRGSAAQSKYSGKK